VERSEELEGVAILAREATPIVTRTEARGDPADDQSRYIEAAVSGWSHRSRAGLCPQVLPSTRSLQICDVHGTL
jgi:exonuclease III